MPPTRAPTLVQYRGTGSGRRVSVYRFLPRCCWLRVARLVEVPLCGAPDVPKRTVEQVADPRDELDCQAVHVQPLVIERHAPLSAVRCPMLRENDSEHEHEHEHDLIDNHAR